MPLAFVKSESRVVSSEITVFQPCRLKASVFALAMAVSTTAWAGQGGAGGSVVPLALPFAGAGGSNGDAAQADGHNASPGLGSTKGGGGGATDITTGFGGSGGMGVVNANANVLPPASNGSAGATGISIVTGAISGGNGSNAPAAVSGANGAGGGGGGVGVTTGANLGLTSSAAVVGGTGGTGSGNVNSGNGGGGGGAGVFSSGNVVVSASASITGGAGGVGFVVGGGGAGGVSLVLAGTGTVINAGSLTGGQGGNGKNNGPTSGQGGSGGEGVWISDGGTLVNESGGTIVGGAPASLSGNKFAAPAGGAGVVGTNAIVVNAGTIAAGANADAIQFIGGVNSLEIQAGSTITGNVVAFGSADTLKLGGDADAGFDVSAIGAGAQYQGFGLFQKTGASTWTLTGTSTEAMPWTVRQGTLALDGSIANSSFTVNAATLTVDGTVDRSTFAVNDGTLGITGTVDRSSFAVNDGTISIGAGGTARNSSFAVNSGGVLAVNGSAATSTVAVNAGGMLRGGGNVGATTVRAGGTVAPGNSIGTLNVNGAYVQEKGSVYQAEVDPASSASDRIAVTGTATLQNGAVINVTRTTPVPYVAGTRYTVLTATDGITGTFNVTGDTSLSALLGLADTYDAGNAYLEVKQTRSISDVATTPNQAATASGLDSLGAGAAAAIPVVNQQTDAAARAALDQLTGEVYPSVQTAMLQSSHFTRDAVSDRLGDTFTCAADAMSGTRGGVADGRDSAGGRTRGAADTAGCAATGRPTGWSRFYGNWGHVDGDSSASRLDTSVGGFFIGADMPLSDTWRAGVLAGYSHGSYRVNGSNASADSDDYHLGVYGGAQWGALGLRTGATYTWHDISADRRLNVGGYSDHLSANYNAGTSQVFGELGYKVDLGRRTSIEPFLNLAYVNQHAEGFDERGGADALHIGSQDMNTGFSTLGLRGTTHFTFNSTDFQLKGMVGWRYAVGDVRPVATESFQGGSSFDISGVPLARNQAVVDLGIGVHITRNATISLSYNGQFSSHTTDQGVLGALNIAF